jgi:glycosyltransferase involved in cell wall biosynthesis
MSRVLYVIHRFWPFMGGSERYFFELARRTAQRGHAVTVCTTDAWEHEHLRQRGRQRIEPLVDSIDGVRIRRFRVRHIPYEQQLSMPLARVRPPDHPSVFATRLFVPALRWWFWTTAERFDLVHAGVFPYTSLIAPAAAYCRRHSVPWVCQPMLNLGEPHSAVDNPYYLSAKQIALLGRATAILANSDYETEVLSQKGVAAGKVTVASPAVTAEQVLGGDGDAFRARRKITGPLILQVSTQTFDKGSVHTVEALKLLWARGSKMWLVLIGQVVSDFATYLAAQPSWVRERILVLGYASEQDKKDAFAACDLFVMPSRADSFGIVYLEAWLYRKPVIGCYAGGVPRVIDDGHDGFLMPFGDAHMLAEYVGMLLRDRALARRMGDAGHAKVIAKYTWEQTYGTVWNVYQQLLAATPRGSAP